jgi:hypothetical protein
MRVYARLEEPIFRNLTIPARIPASTTASTGNQTGSAIEALRRFY